MEKTKSKQKTYSFSRHEIIEHLKTLKRGEKILETLSKRITHYTSHKSSITNQLKVEWYCKTCTGYWFKDISGRTQRGCSYCSGKVVLKGFNDFQTKCLSLGRQEILKEWSLENNFSSSEITAGSNKEIILVCRLGHRYLSTPKKRLKQIHGCQYCTDQKLLTGYNDLESKLKERGEGRILAYWSSRNELMPSESTLSRNGWWTCYSCTQAFNCRNSKMYYGRYCNKCRNISKSSKLEREIVEFIQTLTAEDLLLNHRIEQQEFELDIYLPKAAIGFEVNGEYWHSDKGWSRAGSKGRREKYSTPIKYHAAKLSYFKEKCVTIVYVWENDWLYHKERLKQAIRDFIDKKSIDPMLMRLESEVKLENLEKFTGEEELQSGKTKAE